MIKSFIARNIYEPVYCAVYRRDNRLEYYKFYKDSQWNTIEKNKEIQAKRLYGLIKHASENIPYYHKIVNKNKITFSEKTIFNDIKKFPVLTKEILRKEFKNLYKTFPGLKWHYNHSGGSTGEPVKFIQDQEYEAHSNAETRLQFEWAGYKLGDRQIKLWGSQNEVLQEKEKVSHRFANWIKSVYILDSFSMDKKRMTNYVNIINRKKPRLILAYAQSVNELAKFINENRLRVHQPKSVMTSAGILYPDFRKNIETAFNCPVFNRYGTREVGNVACECEKHEGLHVNILTHYFEILNDRLEPCKEEELGHMYITTLKNFTMPLIRYKIGDMAIYTKKRCSCKRGLPLIKNVVGRDMDVFKTKDGKIIQGEFFIHFIGVVHNKGYISKFQVIQKDYNRLEIKVVVKNKKRFDETRKKIAGSIQKVMGKDCRIRFKVVRDIPPTKSGKYMYTIREF